MAEEDDSQTSFEAPDNRITREALDSLELISKNFVDGHIRSASINTDSVVATAQFEYAEDVSHLVIWWGDETSGEAGQVINLRMTKLKAKSILNSSEFTKGTIKLQHRYDVAEISNFRIYWYYVLNDGSQSIMHNRSVTLVPKYYFRAYTFKLYIHGYLDSIFDQTSEVHIRVDWFQAGTALDSKQWELKTSSNSFPIFLSLKDSDFRYEISLNDEPITARIYIEEKDPNYIDFLKIFDLIPGNSTWDWDVKFLDFHPSDFQSTSVKGTFDIDGEKVAVEFDIEMRLVVPIDTSAVAISSRGFVSYL